MGILKDIHGENGTWSSKRVYGGLLLIVVIACVLAKIEHSLLEPMLYTGAGLIGFNTVVNIAKAIKGKPDETNCG